MKSQWIGLALVGLAACGGCTSASSEVRKAEAQEVKAVRPDGGPELGSRRRGRPEEVGHRRRPGHARERVGLDQHPGRPFARSRAYRPDHLAPRRKGDVRRSADRRRGPPGPGAGHPSRSGVRAGQDRVPAGGRAAGARSTRIRAGRDPPEAGSDGPEGTLQAADRVRERVERVRGRGIEPPLLRPRPAGGRAAASPGPPAEQRHDGDGRSRRAVSVPDDPDRRLRRRARRDQRRSTSSRRRCCSPCPISPCSGRCSTPGRRICRTCRAAGRCASPPASTRIASGRVAWITWATWWTRRRARSRSGSSSATRVACSSRTCTSRASCPTRSARATCSPCPRTPSRRSAARSVVFVRDGSRHVRGAAGGNRERVGTRREVSKGLDGSETVVVAGAFNLKAELLKSTLAGE